MNFLFSGSLNLSFLPSTNLVTPFHPFFPLRCRTMNLLTFTSPAGSPPAFDATKTDVTPSHSLPCRTMNPGMRVYRPGGASNPRFRPQQAAAGAGATAAGADASADTSRLFINLLQLLPVLLLIMFSWLSSEPAYHSYFY